MDSDDYLEKNTLEEIYYEAVDKNVDFLMFKIKNFYDDGKKSEDNIYYTMPYLKKRVGKTVFNYNNVSDIALDLCICMPGNLFKREFIKDIRFPEGLIFEDNVFFTHALFKADRIYFYDKFLYNRQKHFNSTTSTPLIKLLDTIEITDQLLDLTNEFAYYRHKKELFYRIFNNIYSIFKQADTSNKQKFFEKIKKEYKRNKNKWENDDFFTDELNPYYKHMFNCVLNSNKWNKFESCMKKFNCDELKPEKSRFEKLKEMIT